MRDAVAAIAVAVIFATPALAQVETGRAVIAGRINVQGDTMPLSGVEVYIVGSQERQTTDEHGAFRFTGIYPGRYEVRDHEMDRNLVHPQGMNSRAVEPPDPNRRRHEQDERRRRDGYDPLPAKRKPGDRTDARAEAPHKQRIAWKKPPHPP